MFASRSNVWSCSAEKGTDVQRPSTIERRVESISAKGSITDGVSITGWRTTRLNWFCVRRIRMVWPHLTLTRLTVSQRSPRSAGPGTAAFSIRSLEGGLSCSHSRDLTVLFSTHLAILRTTNSTMTRSKRNSTMSSRHRDHHLSAKYQRPRAAPAHSQDLLRPPSR